jgi:hypothetical protein
VRERERERESRLSGSNNIFKYTKLEKKSSCKESINNTFKFSSLYPIIIYLFILLLHTHTLQKSAANASKTHLLKTAANIDGQRKLKRAREEATKPHTRRKKERKKEKKERTGVVRFLRF